MIPQAIIMLVTSARLFWGIKESCEKENPQKRVRGVVVDILWFTCTHAILTLGGWYDNL